MYIEIWTLKLRCTQHEFCGLDDLQECKDNSSFDGGRGWVGRKTFFDQVQSKHFGLPKGCRSRALALIPLKGPFIKKLVGGALVYGKEGSLNQ